jgi:RNA polymerase sigma-70 factor, ECF subfamily
LYRLKEESVIRRCKAGDKEAFRILAEEYESKLFGIAYLMTHDRELAADMVQETLLKMWQHLPSLHNHNGLKPWLIRILINEIKQQSRRKRVPEISIDEVVESSGNQDETTTPLEQNDIRDSIRRAVRMLPAYQRDTIVLRYFSDLSVAEIAVALNCRQGTVKSRLSRALDQLEKILEDFGVSEVIK